MARFSSVRSVAGVVVTSTSIFPPLEDLERPGRGLQSWPVVPVMISSLTGFGSSALAVTTGAGEQERGEGEAEGSHGWFLQRSGPLRDRLRGSSVGDMVRRRDRRRKGQAVDVGAVVCSTCRRD